VLIDDFLSQYAVVERHAIDVKAPPEVVYLAIRSADLAGAFPARLLLALRALPAALLGGRAGLATLASRVRSPITLHEFERSGFVVLAENPPKELLIGLVGAFWKLRGGVRQTDATRFRARQPSGTARAAWNFVVDAGHAGTARLSTETRVEPADPASARRFRAYWFLVRPWSGLTRRCMLRAIRAEAEARASARV
jgi:hypothetical protein